MSVARVIAGATLVAAVAMTPGSEASAGATTRPQPVVIVLVEQLDWATAPSELTGFAKGSMALRTVGDGRVPVDGELTIGKGRRTGGVAGIGGIGRIEPTADGLGYMLGDWDAFLENDRDLRYGGRLGEFGEALSRSLRSWQLVSDNPEALGAVADHKGVAAHAVVDSTAALTADVDGRLTADVDVLVVGLSHRDALPEVLARTGARCTIVSSVSPPNDDAHLGVFAMSSQCGRGTAGLVSTSTSRTPFLMLVDVAPTVLELAGIDRPDSMQGHPARVATRQTVAALVHEDTRARRVDATRERFAIFLAAVYSAAAVWLLVRRRIPSAAAIGLSLIPVASFVMTFLPWWRLGLAGAVSASVAIAAVLTTAALLAARDDRVLAIGIAGAVTAAVLFVDGATGGVLQLDAPLGNSPLIAGRFSGIGNIAFGLALAGALVACAVALDRWGRRALPWVLAATAAAVVLDGAPRFGNDVGGILASIPAAGVLVMAYRTGKIPVRRVALLAVVAGIAVTAFAIVDLRQAPDAQTHLARWLSSNDRFDTIIRKAESAGRTFSTSRLGLLLPLPIVAMIRDRRRYAVEAWTRALVASLVVGAVAGTLLNDSGVEVAAAFAMVGFPVIAWLANREGAVAVDESAPTDDDLDVDFAALSTGE